jgi:hypothetical protein
MASQDGSSRQGDGIDVPVTIFMAYMQASSGNDRFMAESSGDVAQSRL